MEAISEKVQGNRKTDVKREKSGRTKGREEEVMQGGKQNMGEKEGENERMESFI